MTGLRPRLALGIPARNAHGHLPRLLDTVSNQTVPFDEILLYDDASTDETGAIARSFGATVIRTEVNTGPSLGKNVMAERSACAWIHFHDADEAFYPRFVERAHSWMTSDDVDVLLFSTEDRDDATGEVLGQRQWSDAELQADAIRYCILNNVTNCGVYRRSAFLAAGGFDTSANIKYNEDQAMHLRLAIAGLRFRAERYIGDIIYRRMNSMSSGHPIECARAHYHVLENAARATGSHYATEIGGELWKHAGVCGTYRDWNYVRRCLKLAQVLCADPVRENTAFRAMARVYPFGAVAIREHFIRWFKPDLRADVPTV